MADILGCCAHPRNILARHACLVMRTWHCHQICAVLVAERDADRRVSTFTRCRNGFFLRSRMLNDASRFRARQAMLWVVVVDCRYLSMGGRCCWWSWWLWLLCWVVGWSVAGWLAGWLVGWLVGCVEEA